MNPPRDGGAGPTGLLLVDKPAGVTSHDVVGRARALLGTRRVGHAGTLDPMATGLLVLGVGRATKLLGHLAMSTKEYMATIRLGEVTTTDDAEGDTVGGGDAGRCTDDEIDTALTSFTGRIDQVPSAVSAIKVDGQRAYARVRAGETVELPARPVTVSRFDRIGPVRRAGARADLDVVVSCSSGTYVRALARDLGAHLGVGGHLTVLRRGRVGPFSVDDAADLFPGGIRAADGRRPPIDDAQRRRTLDALVAVDDVAARVFPVRRLSVAEATDLGHGRPLAATGEPGVVAAVDGDGRLVALVADRDGAARPVFVWRPAGTGTAGTAEQTDGA